MKKKETESLTKSIMLQTPRTSLRLPEVDMGLIGMPKNAIRVLAQMMRDGASSRKSRFDCIGPAVSCQRQQSKPISITQTKSDYRYEMVIHFRGSAVLPESGHALSADTSYAAESVGFSLAEAPLQANEFRLDA